MKINHSISQKDLPIEMQILNISVNLARLSQWIFEGYTKRPQLIDKFLIQTKNYLNDLESQNISKEFKPTLDRFSREFGELECNIKEENKLFWAEKALTWANILQHRAKLA